MDFKQLITFHRIVQAGSFNRAAQEMNYVQSTVTMQIQKLEAELGIRLIERGKGIRLTEAGRLFYSQSRDIVKNMEQLQSNLSDLKNGESGHIRLGVTEPTASYRLPGILKDFMVSFPKVKISVEVSSTPHLSEQVLRGELDFALCTAPSLGSELYFEPLFNEEFVVLVPEDHPLVHKTIIDLKDLQGHRLLITAATCPYRRKLEMALHEENITLDTMEIGSMTALKFYVESGLGIALVPGITVASISKGTIARAISGHLVEMAFGILCTESTYPFQLASQKLYQHLKHALTAASSN
ncbi:MULTISPECIES: LysR family transcriptional regulator [Paenibacillus]|uniref:LysR family transcriptional regulator n=1 Tax=Paenibacillus TaxID=44249 RepID=UPI0003A22BD3|nr:LysR family transcriptional regulator [Paenibacillus massiliensis]